MLKNYASRFCVFLCCLITLASCGGGDSNTNGTLTLTTAAVTDLTGGLSQVDVVATYVNTASSGALEGFPIRIQMTAHKLDGTTVGTPVDDKLKADSAGVVKDQLLVPQTNYDIFVDVVASSGGLSDRKTLKVPSIAALTVSPTVVAFPPDALAGSTQTVTISGGQAPYSATVDSAHAGDINVSIINGNTINLTKLKNSVTNGPAILATLSVSDSSGATPVAINVSYN